MDTRKKQHMCKCLIAFLVCTVMVCGLLPTVAFADGVLSYNPGEGSGSDFFTDPASSATVLSWDWAGNLAGGWTAPDGAAFTGWLGSDGETYQPGDTITLSGDVTLSAQYQTSGPVYIHNDFELLGSKELEGGTLFADQFTFSLELTSDGGSGATFNFSSPVTNAADGSVLFSVTSTDVPSTFSGNVLFEIVEVNDHQAGISYDESPIEASVPFENGVADTNSITYTRLGADSSREEIEGADFTNTITNTSNDFNLLGSKELEGGTLFADQFTFSAELKSDGGSGATFNFSSPVTNAADGSVLFSVTSTDVPSAFSGNVLFEIVEVNDHQAGISYDSSPIEASVPFENGVVDTNGITYTRLGADGSREEIEGADFTNTCNTTETPATGSLTVSKTISGNGASATKDFTFTVTLAQTGSTFNATYGDMTFVDGVATFTLKGGESKTATGLPAGVTYTVAESDNAGYTVTVNGTKDTTATGTIVADETAAAAFNNYRSGGSAHDGNVPQTGDNSSVGLWMVIMLCSFFECFGLIIFGRKRGYAGKHCK